MAQGVFGVSGVLRLSLPNELAALETARLALHEHLAGLAISPKAWYRIELVLEETLMNRIWHAYPPGERHLIGLEAQALPTLVSLRFTDDGLPFDPLQHPEPARPATLQEARPGGLGLLLTRKAVSAAHYVRESGRNVLTLSVARA